MFFYDNIYYGCVTGENKMTAKEKIKALREKMSKMKKSLALGTLLTAATVSGYATETSAKDKKIDTAGVDAAKDSLNIDSSYDEFARSINEDFDKFDENNNKEFETFKENMGQEGEMLVLNPGEERSDQTDINTLLAEQAAMRKAKEEKTTPNVSEKKAPTAAPKYVERTLDFDARQAKLIGDALSFKEVVDNGRISNGKKLQNNETGKLRSAQIKSGQITMAKALGDVKQLHYEGGLSVLSYGDKYVRLNNNGQADQMGVLHPSSMKDLKGLKLMTPASRTR